MTEFRTFSRHLSLIVALVTLSIFNAGIFSAQAANSTNKTAPRIAFFTFKVNAAKDMSYLQNGIRDMLATRLSANVGARIINNESIAESLAVRDIVDPGTLNSEAVKELGTTLGADFLVLGSVTVLGSSMSLDTRTIPMAAGEEPQTFYAIAPTEDDVLPAINRMAWDISNQMFGKKKPADLATGGNSPASKSATKELSSFQTAHPDRAFLQPSSNGGFGPRSPFVKAKGIGGIGSALGFIKTQDLEMTIQAMDVGDVDGDGKDDMVLASADDVHFYHISNNRLVEFKKISLGARYKVHSITLADLNDNSRDEVYISSADTKSPYSFGLEWQDKDFSYLFKREPWYVRALKIARNKTVLAGQKGGVTDLFQQGIHELEIVDGKLKKTQKMPVHNWLNLFDFSMADLDGDAQPEVIAVSQSDRLMVMRLMGRLNWQSQDPFGGTNRYVGELRDLQRTGINMDDGHPADGLEDKAERIYIQPRIVTADINGDELDDVIYLQNKSMTARVSDHLKGFVGGEVYGLSWNGIGLGELWRTRKIDGYIAECQFRPDPENADKGTLYVAIHLGAGGMFGGKGSGRSTVLIYPMDFTTDQVAGRNRP